MRFLTYLTFMFLLAACGEISYKQGGSAQDIEKAHQACRGAGDQLSTCLAKQGWQKPKMDAFDPLFATVTLTDNRQPDPSSTSSAMTVEVKKTVTEPSDVVANKQQDVHSTQKVMDNRAPTSTGQAATTPQSSTINDGPDVSYAINSWWKMGGFPDLLAKDQRSCELKLGPQYQPDYKTQTYKRAFVVCMHDFGWVAVRNIK